MNSIVIPEALWPSISHMDPGGRESAGIALASLGSTSTTLLIRLVFTATADDYVVRDDLRVTLTPAFVARVAAVAKQESLCVVFFHTHPGSRWPNFSTVDDTGELHLAEFLARRIPGLPHATLLIGADNHVARILGTGEELEVQVVGRHVTLWSRPIDESTANRERFDRQVRFFGTAAQSALGRLGVAIVGVGGTGSIVAQELAHLGVQRFRLVDPDSADESNLSRVVGASQQDIGRKKVDIASRLIRGVNDSTEIVLRPGSVNPRSEVEGLLSCDLIVCCTDSHGSRYILNQVAYQYYIPVVDVGVAIAAVHGKVTHVFGRVQLLSPGLPCLTCLRLLDPHQVRRDLMSEAERSADPYFIGDAEPQPAVISLNATMSSLAVSMILGIYAKIPFAARYQLYDALRGTVRPLAAAPMSDCVTCSAKGALGRGATWPVPGTIA